MQRDDKRNAEIQQAQIEHLKIRQRNETARCESEKKVLLQTNAELEAKRVALKRELDDLSAQTLVERATLEGHDVKTSRRIKFLEEDHKRCVVELNQVRESQKINGNEITDLNSRIRTLTARNSTLAAEVKSRHDVLVREHAQQLADLRATTETRIQEIKRAYTDALERKNTVHEENIRVLQQQQQQLATQKRDASPGTSARRMEQLEEKHRRELMEIKEAHQRELRATLNTHATEQDELRAQHDAKVARLRDTNSTLVDEIKKLSTMFQELSTGFETTETKLQVLIRTQADEIQRLTRLLDERDQEFKQLATRPAETKQEIQELTPQQEKTIALDYFIKVADELGVDPETQGLRLRRRRPPFRERESESGSTAGSSSSSSSSSSSVYDFFFGE